jgi:tRNA-uridine 2-sulfurtransferase
MPRPRVVVAMSGGVDSSVAAGLLLQQGYDVIGVTMRLWTEDDPNAARHHKRCCSVEDTDDARAAADVLGIRHYVINLEREFKSDVVDRFVAEYARGRTPNPCLACNDKVKFRPLLEHALALGADYLATGHYARVQHTTSRRDRASALSSPTSPSPTTHSALTSSDHSQRVATQRPSPTRRDRASALSNRTSPSPTTHRDLTSSDHSQRVAAQGPSPESQPPPSTPTTAPTSVNNIAPRPRTGEGSGVRATLLRAIDPTKDQSYVLYTLTQAELSRTLFPVGEFPKDDIRRMAREWSLPNADKPDSADICFIPTGDYRAFVRERIPVTAGDIIDTAGRTLGEHDGIVNYTVGQRRGVPARGNAEPLFVVDIDADSNRVVVGSHDDLMATALVADELTFIDGEPPASDIRVDARIRYRSPAVPATLSVRGDTAEVHFDSPQRAVTPGQAVVFYDAERVIGGGTIARRL